MFVSEIDIEVISKIEKQEPDILLHKLEKATLDYYLRSIAASHNKPTLGLETFGQIMEYKRMNVREDEKVLLNGIFHLKHRQLPHLFTCSKAIRSMDNNF